MEGVTEENERTGSTVNFTTLNVAMSPYNKFFEKKKRDHSYKHC
jgi:hypothetical protein